MNLKKIRIKNFRNIKDFESSLATSTNIIVAPNAAGKTNLLEAISMLSYGKSIKAKKQSQLFHNGRKSNVIFIEGLVKTANQTNKYTLGLAKEEKHIKKICKIDDDPIPYSQFVGRVITLFFTTSTIDLLSRSPSSRRRFLDRIIWLISPEYRKQLNKYVKALRQRNAALETKLSKIIAPWTKTVVESGASLIEERNRFFQNLQKKVTEAEKTLLVKFKPSVKLSTVFEESAEERFANLLKQNFGIDLERGTTTVGPHRDDWTILSKVRSNSRLRDLQYYGSRGEQRMAILSMFIGILKVTEEKTGTSPILLLDDLFSELDNNNQAKLIKMVSKPDFQVIATTTPNTHKAIKKKFNSSAKTIRL